MSEEDDDEQLVLFVDMLGFAALIEKTPAAVAKLEPAFRPAKPVDGPIHKPSESDIPLVAMFSGFHEALEQRISEYFNKDLTAITFSDSAYIHMPAHGNVVSFARALMRDLIRRRVPARMGLGAGSFAALRFMSDNTSKAHTHSTQFLGSAVVRAYHAESRSGVRGLRIVMHPSARALFSPMLVRKTRVLPLPEKSESASAEVNYLYMEDERKTTPQSVGRRFEELRQHLVEMRKVAPPDKKHYYENTTEALRRMREAFGAAKHPT